MSYSELFSSINCQRIVFFEDDFKQIAFDKNNINTSDKGSFSHPILLTTLFSISIISFTAFSKQTSQAKQFLQPFSAQVGKLKME